MENRGHVTQNFGVADINTIPPFQNYARITVCYNSTSNSVLDKMSNNNSIAGLLCRSQ